MLKMNRMKDVKEGKLLTNKHKWPTLPMSVLVLVPHFVRSQFWKRCHLIFIVTLVFSRLTFFPFLSHFVAFLSFHCIRIRFRSVDIYRFILRHFKSWVSFRLIVFHIGYMCCWFCCSPHHIRIFHSCTIDSSFPSFQWTNNFQVDGHTHAVRVHIRNRK